jgi:hypothetical protein
MLAQLPLNMIYEVFALSRGRERQEDSLNPRCDDEHLEPWKITEHAAITVGLSVSN